MSLIFANKCCHGVYVDSELWCEIYNESAKVSTTETCSCRPGNVTFQMMHRGEFHSGQIDTVLRLFCMILCGRLPCTHGRARWYLVSTTSCSNPLHATHLMHTIKSRRKGLKLFIPLALSLGLTTEPQPQAVSGTSATHVLSKVKLFHSFKQGKRGSSIASEACRFTRNNDEHWHFFQLATCQFWFCRKKE